MTYLIICQFFFFFQNEQPSCKEFYSKTIRIVNEETLSDLSNKLNDVDWSILENKDPNEAYDIFHKIFNDIYNEALPLKVIKYRISSNKLGLRLEF